MTNADLIGLIYGIGGSIFLLGFLVAVVTTGARVLWYVRHHEPRPRLLNRDVIVKSGMFVAFGSIAALRFLPIEARLAFTQDNITWALVTTGAAVISILVYDWYELVVIPRVRR